MHKKYINLKGGKVALPDQDQNYIMHQNKQYRSHIYFGSVLWLSVTACGTHVIIWLMVIMWT